MNARAELKARIRAGDHEVLASLDHGTLSAYSAGCVCAACRRAMSDYQKERRHELGLSKRWQPSEQEKRAAVEMARVYGVAVAARRTGYGSAAIREWTANADVETIERAELLAEIDQVRNGMDDRHCVVDGVPLPGHREKTCSSRCAALWTACRYHLDETSRDDITFGNALWCIEKTDDAARLRWARRVAAGQETKVHGRWLLSESIKAKLEEVLTRREHAKNQWGDLAATMPPIPALERGIARRSA